MPVHTFRPQDADEESMALRMKILASTISFGNNISWLGDFIKYLYFHTSVISALSFGRTVARKVRVRNRKPSAREWNILFVKIKPSGADDLWHKPSKRRFFVAGMEMDRLQFVQPSAFPLVGEEVVDILQQRFFSRRQQRS